MDQKPKMNQNKKNTKNQKMDQTPKLDQKSKNGSKAKNESTEEMDQIQMKNLSLCFGVR